MEGLGKIRKEGGKKKHSAGEKNLGISQIHRNNNFQNYPVYSGCGEWIEYHLTFPVEGKIVNSISDGDCLALHLAGRSEVFFLGAGEKKIVCGTFSKRHVVATTEKGWLVE